MTEESEARRGHAERGGFGGRSAPDAKSRTPQDLVGLYLRAQNLEQIHRMDEAATLYEEAVAAGFDSAGPYDRLIAIYLAAERHDDVLRVAQAALENVRTFLDKRNWYETLISEARSAIAERRDHRGAEF